MMPKVVGGILAQMTRIVRFWSFAFLDNTIIVSIRPATGIEPLYIAIATVTINLIVAVAIILLNLYVAVSAGPRIPPLVLSIHFPDVAASICAGAVPAVPHELPFYNKAFGR